MESLTSGYNECENACFNTTGEMEGSIIEFQSSIQNTGTGRPILKDTILVVEIYICFEIISIRPLSSHQISSNQKNKTLSKFNGPRMSYRYDCEKLDGSNSVLKYRPPGTVSYQDSVINDFSKS